jgi:arabinofuranan 3-O-arabinosyltransferase
VTDHRAAARRLRHLFLAVIAVAALTVAFGGRLTREMPDFEVYWRAAARASSAEPLYRVDDQHYQFKYLPAFAVLASPIGRLPLATAKTLWLATSALLIVLLLALSLDILPSRRRPAWLLVAATVVVMAKFYGHELLLGQVNLLFAVVLTGAVSLLRRDQEVLAGVLVALAVVIKPYAVLFLPWLAVRRRPAPVLSAAAGVLGALLLPMLVYGPAGTLALHRAWWETVTTSTAPNLLNQDNVSLAAMYAKWIGPGATAAQLSAATGLLLIVVAAWAVRRRPGVVFPEALEAGLLLTLVPLLSPQGWDYVFLIATPAVMVLVNGLDELPAGVRAVAAAALLVIGLSLFDLLGRTAYARFMALSMITLCFLVVVAALAALRQRRAA